MTRYRYEKAAYDLGAEHARAQATWVTDGNDTDESRRIKLQRIEDDGVDSVITRPNLSGEWVESLTPTKLFEAIARREPSPRLDGDLMTRISQAYEEGVSDNFEAAVEAELRTWLGDEAA